MRSPADNNNGRMTATCEIAMTHKGARSFRRRANRTGCALFEPLESRLLLANAPTFVTDPADQTTTPFGDLIIEINAEDADGDPITVTAASDTSNVVVSVPTAFSAGNRYGLIHFSNIIEGPTTFGGDVLIVLFETRRPITTQRFVTLATTGFDDQGIVDPDLPAFWTAVPVHRVIPGFVMQTGDAENGTGTGGSPLGVYPGEFDPVITYDEPFKVGAANTSPNSNDAQFFITDETATPPVHLNNANPIFGEMIAGFDVFDKIINVPRDTSDRPFITPIMDSVDILERPLTISVADGFVGDAHVTVTLDDGDAGTTDAVRTFTVTSLGDQPVITPNSDLVATPDASLMFGVVDDGGLDVELTGAAMPGTGELTIDDDTGTFEFSVPEGFTGLSRLSLQAVEQGFNDRQPLTTETFHVLSQNPGDPPVLGRAETNQAGSALATFQQGDTLFVANGAAGLEAFDISDPSDPQLVGISSQLGIFRDLTLVDDIAFVAFNNGPVDAEAGLLVFDVSDPTSILFINGAVTPGDAIALIVDGDIAFVAADEAGLALFDISQMLDDDPATTDLPALGLLKDLQPGEALGRAVGLAKLDDTLFISDGENGGVVVMNVPTPLTMTFIGRIVQPNAPGGIAAHEDRMYVVDLVQGLFMFDVSKPADPTLLGFFQMGGLPTEITLAGTVAIISTANGFEFIDISVPEVMTSLYSFATPLGAAQTSASGTRFSLPIGTDGVVIMDGLAVQNTFAFTNKFTIVDDNDVKVTITVKNAVARITTTGVQSGDIVRLEIIGANKATTITFKTKNGKTTIGDVFLDGPARKFTAKTVNLAGNFIANGAVLALALHNIDENHLIEIGPSNNPKDALKFSANEIRETTLRSQIPIKAAKFLFWHDRDGVADEIATNWIGKLTAKGVKNGEPGDIEVGLNVSGVDAVKNALNKVKAAGTLSGIWQIGGDEPGANGDARTIHALSADPDWNATFTGTVKTIKFKQDASGDVTALAVTKFNVKNNYTDATLTLTMDTTGDKKTKALGKLSVKNLIERVIVNSRGRIGTIKAAAVNELLVVVGLAGDVADLPDSVDLIDRTMLDAAAQAAITSIKIKGTKGGPPALIDSSFIAWSIGKAAVGIVEQASAIADNAFGFVATEIGSLAYTDGVTKFKAKKPEEFATLVFDEDFMVSLV